MTPISNEQVERAARALAELRVRYNLEHEDVVRPDPELFVQNAVAFAWPEFTEPARAALEAAAVGGDETTVPVPRKALLWLMGEGPDSAGKWFGETVGDGIPKLAGKYSRTYWWRSIFRSMVPNWPEPLPNPPSSVEMGNGGAVSRQDGKDGAA